QFAAAQGAVALCFETVEQRLRSFEPFEHIAKGSIVVVGEDAFGKAKIQHRVEPKEHRVVAIQFGRVLPDIPVVCIICGSSDFAEQKEAALAERVSVLANVRTKSRAGKLT